MVWGKFRPSLFTYHHTETRPKPALVEEVASEVLTRINESAILSPSGLFATVLLSTPNKALTKNNLLKVAKLLFDLQVHAPFHKNVILPKTDIGHLFNYTAGISNLSYFTYKKDNIVYLNDESVFLLQYYKNNATHLFALPSLIASVFRHNDTYDKETLYEICSFIYLFLQQDLFLPWPKDKLSEKIDEYINYMVHRGLLHWDSQKTFLKRPNILTDEYSYFKILGAF